MTIAEVSRKYGISADTLRYYERIGLLPQVARNKSGIREYTEKDCEWVKFIKCMRNAGVQIEALIEYLELFKQGDGTILARKNILIEQKLLLSERIKGMQQTLDYLNYKIDNYELIIQPMEKKLKSKLE